MPKSFLVRRFKSFQIEDIIRDDNIKDVTERRSYSPSISEDYFQDHLPRHSSPTPDFLKCNCSFNQNDSISTCSSDSIASPLYDKHSYENIYINLNSKILKEYAEQYNTEQEELSKHNSSFDEKDVTFDDDKDCYHRKGIYPITLGLEDTAKPFNCNICGKSFRLSSTLCRHKIIHTSQRPHKCYICFKSFNRSSTLKTHLRTHNTTKEFVCKICGKGFHQKGNLRNHTLIHTGEKPYQCRICSKAFNKLSNLKFHMHCHTDQKPYRCRFCKVSMARRGELKLHIATYHADEVEQK